MKRLWWILAVVPAFLSSALLGQDPPESGPEPSGVVEQSDADERAWLGVYPVDLSNKVRFASKLYRQPGVAIKYVEPGSPAEKAGLVNGDILQLVDDQRIYNADQLRQLLPSLKPDEAVDLHIVRGVEKHHLTAMLGRRVPRPESADTKSMTLSKEDLDRIVVEKGIPPGLPGFNITVIKCEGEKTSFQDAEGTIELLHGRITVLDRNGKEIYRGSISEAPKALREKTKRLLAEWKGR